MYLDVCLMCNHTESLQVLQVCNAQTLAQTFTSSISVWVLRIGVCLLMGPFARALLTCVNHDDRTSCIQFANTLR